MKKRYAFFIALVIITITTLDSVMALRDSGKKKQIDNCNLAITYRARISKDTLGKKFFFDNQILEIGDNFSHYYSAFSENIDSVMWQARQNPSNGIDDAVATRKNMGKNEDGNYEDLFFNYPSAGLVTVVNRFFNNDYAYTEPIETINWNIEIDIDSIIGYKCQKATCSFRGRKWTAWFTTEIPIHMGPYKFGGLPGMILKLYDKQELFIYQAIGIEQTENRSIYKYDTPSVKSTRKNVAKLLEMRWQDPETLALANGVKGIKFMTMDRNGVMSEVKDHKNMQIPYIPQIELQ